MKEIPTYELPGDVLEARVLKMRARMYARAPDDKKREERLFNAALGYVRRFDREFNKRPWQSEWQLRGRIIARLREQGMSWKKISEAFEITTTRAQWLVRHEGKL